MSAVIVKGIIISLSVVAAVGIVLQTPEVRDWLEDQRRKIAELLCNISDGLDADTRREAEAFAFEGRMPSQRDSFGPSEALALATGRQLDGDNIGRRLNRQNSSDAIDAEERRRLGREYLARRNQEMMDVRKKREEAYFGTAQPGSAMPAASPSGSTTINEARAIEGSALPLAIAAVNLNNSTLQTGAGSPSSSSNPATVIGPGSAAFNAGAHFGNPFGDEFSFSDDPTTDRATTPKPPLPPKVPVSPAITASRPISIPITDAAAPEETTNDLSYDEQLARALSLSLADKEEKARKTLRRTMTEEEAFARALVASLRDNHSPRKEHQDLPSSSRGPLVDLFQQPSHPQMQPEMSSNNPWKTRSETDELYFLTPMPTGQTRNRILDTDHPSLAEALEKHAGHSVSAQQAANLQEGDDASKTLSPAVLPSAPSSATFSPLLAARDNLSSGFMTDSDIEDFASLPGSGGQSIASMVEVEDVGIESLSEDDDGITTPSSWSEISSQVDEFEHSELGAGETTAL